MRVRRLLAVLIHARTLMLYTAGGLAEPPVPGAMVGELIHAVLTDQFEALRDGDRFWYARVLSPDERRRVERTRLSDLIRRNTAIGDELPDDVFHVR